MCMAEAGLSHIWNATVILHMRIYECATVHSTQLYQYQMQCITIFYLQVKN